MAQKFKDAKQAQDWINSQIQDFLNDPVNKPRNYSFKNTNPLDETRTEPFRNWMAKKDKEAGNTERSDMLKQARKMAGADLKLGTDDDQNQQQEPKTAEEARLWIDQQVANYRIATNQPDGAEVDPKKFQQWLIDQDKKNGDKELQHNYDVSAKLIKKAGKGKAAGAESGEGAGGEEGDNDGRGEENGLLKYAEGNKWGLGAALMVGLLATAMGGGGILALILGLLAMMLIGGMMGENGLLGGKKEAGPAHGQTREKEHVPPTPGHEKAIDVEEGTNVQMVKMEGTKRTYLKGQKENGELEYGDQATDIQLRTLKDGKVTGYVNGKVSGNSFNVESTSTTLPDGREGETVKSFSMITLGGDGEISMKSGAMADARKPSATLAGDYVKPTKLSVIRGGGDNVSADLAKVTVEGEKGEKTEYTVVMTGKANGKDKVAFDHVVLRDAKGKLLTGADNDTPISIELPSDMMKNVAIATDNTIAPMTGDVNFARNQSVEILKKRGQSQTDLDKKRSDELGKIKDDLGKKTDKDQTLDFIKEEWRAKLKEAGVKDGHDAARMAAEVTAMYDNKEFQGKDASVAAAEIAGKLPDGVDKAKVSEFANRTHETFAAKVKSFDTADDGAKKETEDKSKGADARDVPLGDDSRDKLAAMSRDALEAARTQLGDMTHLERGTNVSPTGGRGGSGGIKIT